MRQLLADLLGTLNALNIDPQELRIEVPLSSDPYVHITFHRVADIQAFAKTDKVKVERNAIKSHGHEEYSAIYDRPGRRMLLQCHVTRHSPDWPVES